MKVAALLALLVAGCGAPRAYLGIDLRDRPGDGMAIAIQYAARLAAAGNKPAMLIVGEHFERLGDLNRACLAYRAAGTTTGGTTYVYSPPVTPGGAGRVVPITTPVDPGIPTGAERRGPRLSRDRRREGGVGVPAHALTAGNLGSGF